MGTPFVCAVATETNAAPRGRCIGCVALLFAVSYAGEPQRVRRGGEARRGKMAVHTGGNKCLGFFLLPNFLRCSSPPLPSCCLNPPLPPSAAASVMAAGTARLAALSFRRRRSGRRGRRGCGIRVGVFWRRRRWCFVLLPPSVSIGDGPARPRAGERRRLCRQAAVGVQLARTGE